MGPGELPNLSEFLLICLLFLTIYLTNFVLEFLLLLSFFEISSLTFVENRLFDTCFWL